MFQHIFMGSIGFPSIPRTQHIFSPKRLRLSTDRWLLIFHIRKMFQPRLLAALFGLLRGHGPAEMPDDDVIANLIFTLLHNLPPGL